MSFVVKNRLANLPTLFLFGIEFVAYAALLAYQFDSRYFLSGMVLQIPLFMVLWFSQTSPYTKSLVSLCFSGICRLGLFMLIIDDGAGYSFGAGLFPLVLYYYVQFQRTLGMSEIEKQKNIEPQ